MEREKPVRRPQPLKSWSMELTWAQTGILGIFKKPTSLFKLLTTNVMRYFCILLLRKYTGATFWKNNLGENIESWVQDSCWQGKVLEVATRMCTMNARGNLVSTNKEKQYKCPTKRQDRETTVYLYDWTLCSHIKWWCRKKRQAFY